MNNSVDYYMDMETGELHFNSGWKNNDDNDDDF